MSKFSERVRMLRQDMNLSLRQLAKLTGISPSAIHSYETGTREPSYQSLEALSDIFNCDIDYLIGKIDVKNSVAAALGVESLAEYYKKSPRDTTITEGEKAILEAYRSLPEAARDKLTQLLARFQALVPSEQENYLDALLVMLRRNP